MRRARRGIRLPNPYPSMKTNSYSGPIIRKKELIGKTSNIIVLNDVIGLSSTAGGAIANVLGSSPSGSPNWADTNTVWGEFRTLGFSVTFKPYNRYSKTLTTTTIPYITIDRRNGTALTSVDDAIRYSTARMMSLEDPWTITVKMASDDEADFQPVNTPTSVMWVKMFATGLTVSTAYGDLFIRYRVQFRNVE